MANLRQIYKIEAVISIIFGVFLFINTQFTVIGAAIGAKEIAPEISGTFGLIFLFLGVALFIIIKKRKK